MSVQLNLPPGFRFHPTDDELVEHYLCRKCSGLPVPVPIVAEIDLYKFDPWQLPGVAVYGEKEWYFFSPRDRKYPNGSRPNRAAGTGYWKATGADKPIGRQRTLGIKKALVFYTGKAPTGVKTNWIMHEYRLANVDRSAGKNKQLRLDDWVLCRIYNKKGSISWNEQCQRAQAAVKSEHPPESLPPVMADTFRVEDSGSPPWAATESSASDSLVSERPVQSSGRQYELSRTAGPQSYYIACNEFGDYPPQASLCSLPDMIMSMHNPWSFT